MKSLYVILFCGCSAWQPNPIHTYKIVYADGYDIANQQQITVATKTAADDWTAATNGYINFTFDDFDPNIPTITIKGEPKAQIDEESNPGVDGITHLNGSASSYIRVGYDLNDNEDLLRRVMTHEFGHSIGLIHTGPDTLMYWNLDGAATHITCADVAQMCMAWNKNKTDSQRDCDPTDMPACLDNTKVACSIPDGQGDSVAYLCSDKYTYIVQVGPTSYAPCGDDNGIVGQTCYVSGVQGVCVVSE